MIKEKVKSVPSFEFKITLDLNEEEARALQAMTVYGTKSFLEYFYKCLGHHYLSPYEKGVYSLFETISREMPKHFKKADDIKNIINDKTV